MAWSFLREGCNLYSAAAAAVFSAIIDAAFAQITLRQAELNHLHEHVYMPGVAAVCAGHVGVMHACHC